jgi:hypothetical protein
VWRKDDDGAAEVSARSGRLDTEVELEVLQAEVTVAHTQQQADAGESQHGSEAWKRARSVLAALVLT